MPISFDKDRGGPALAESETTKVYEASITEDGAAECGSRMQARLREIAAQQRAAQAEREAGD